MEETRVDKWLWAVRLYKTRAQAQQACRAGHVRVGGDRVKPAAPVRVGDTVRARRGGRERIVEVTALVDSRVSATVAASCYVDRTPPPSAAEDRPAVPRRERGSGRPTKRERRQLERLRGGRGH